MNILITGTSRGIGRAIAKCFLHEGHMVIGIDRLPSSIDHPHYEHHVLDIRNEKNYPSLPAIDILINNAGVEQGEEVFDTNLKATIAITERYGIHPGIHSILFVASASARTGAEYPEYAASKGGVVAYMKNVASRVAAFGATCNAISPGGVLTESNAHILNDPAKTEEVLNETLLHRWAEEEEIAAWAYFLTVVNRSMTAQDLLIDNGEEAKFHFVQ